jgi:hypothetical protein
MVMSPRHFRCVVLVIAHHNKAYEPFKRIWEAHWNTYADDVLRDLACFYLYNDPNQVEPVVVTDGCNLTFPQEETYPTPGLLLKTFDAIQYLSDKNLTYDLLLRTNLSSLFNWPAFVEYLPPSGVERFVAGVEYKPKYISGMCLLLSDDLVRDITHNRFQIEFGYPDDHAIAVYLLEHQPGLTYHHIPSITVRYYWDVLYQCLHRCVYGVRDIVHMRFHAGSGLTNRRHWDHRNMRAMHQMLTSRLYFYVLLCVPLIGCVVLFLVYKRMRTKDTQSVVSRSEE